MELEEDGLELSPLGMDPVSSVSISMGQSLDFFELHFSQPHRSSSLSQRGNQALDEMN